MTEAATRFVTCSPLEKLQFLNRHWLPRRTIDPDTVVPAVLVALREEAPPLRLAALTVLGAHIEHFPTALEILAELVHDPDENIRSTAACIVGTALPRVCPPQVIFDLFAPLNPHDVWEVHQTLPMFFRLQRSWFLDTPAAQAYLHALFAQSDLPLVVREQALDAICRLLPYQHPLVRQSINAALEDDDPWIRAQGYELYEAYLWKDQVVHNAQQRGEVEE